MTGPTGDEPMDAAIDRLTEQVDRQASNLDAHARGLTDPASKAYVQAAVTALWIEWDRRATRRLHRIWATLLVALLIAAAAVVLDLRIGR